MRIAVISNSAASLLNFRGPLLVEMVRRGHEVLAFAPDYDAKNRVALVDLGVEPVDYAVSRAGTNPLRELGSIFELRRLFRQYNIELSFSYFIKPVIYGTIAGWLAGVPRRYGMIEGLGFAFTEAPGQSRTRRLLQSVITSLLRFACRRADRIIFLNTDDQQEFVIRQLVGVDKTYLLGAIGLDLDEWPQVPLPDVGITFLLAARLLRDKGVEDYIAAIRILRSQGVGNRFLLLGGLDDNPAAIKRAEVEAWVAQGLVEWPGHVAVRPWMAQAHVFVLPSYYREGVPRSTQEAMSMGRAIITTDMPGCRDTVADGANGWLVPTRNPQKLAEAMRRFIDNPQIILAMGNESRRMAVRDFDAHRQNVRLLDCMRIPNVN